MARYIDVNNALKVIYYYKEKHCENRNRNPINYGTLLDFINQINNIPSEDVKPVVRGKWIEKKAKDGQRYLQCSLCGRNKMDMTYDDFCKFCGAEMESEG